MKRAPAKPGEPQSWLKVHVSHVGEACLIWPFGHSGTGYAQVKWDGRPQTASRVMCILAHGVPPAGKQEVAHSCGNRTCVNPLHLRHASWHENCADKVTQGRENFGERNGRAKLTKQDVVRIIEIYAAGQHTQKQIGEMFGIWDSAVCNIITGKRWKSALKRGDEVPGAQLVTGPAGLMVRTK